MLTRNESKVLIVQYYSWVRIIESDRTSIPHRAIIYAITTAYFPKHIYNLVEEVYYIISILFVIRDFEQTLGGYILFWKLAFFSLLFSVCCVLILNYYYNLKEENYNIFGISICFFLLVPNVGVFINKNFNNEVVKQHLHINYKEITKRSRGGDSYNIFIHTEFDKNERLDISEEFYNSINNDQAVILTLSKGILGYYYVQKIEIDKQYN